ncbi:MAG: hypothetical protein ACOY0T_07960 [Myxococcota bacterium]
MLSTGKPGRALFKPCLCASLVLAQLSFVAPARAADTLAASADANAEKQKASDAAPAKPAAPSLSLAPDAPQMGGLVLAPTKSANEPVVSDEPKFSATGYFRAPLRFSWGKPTTPDPNGSTATQLRSPPLVPDANYVDWRYTNSQVGPWTELNFHYGNARVKGTVQLASYNLTDSGYRKLESNLGINQAFVTINFPELFDSRSRLTLIAGGFTNRYGAAGRYDAGKYETYLFGRTHVVGETLRFEYDLPSVTLMLEHGFGGKLEPIPFFGASTGPRDNLSWNPYPGEVPQEAAFVHHAHLGGVIGGKLLLGAHYINVFANDNERAGAFLGRAFGGRPSSEASPYIKIFGGDVKLLGGPLGDGYIGYSRLNARNADYLGDAVEVLHSFNGLQLHDNYFGNPGTVERATGSIDSVLFQYVFSFAQALYAPQPFWGQGPDLVASIYGMYNNVSGATNPEANHARLKFGADLTYVPLSWLGVGARYDNVQPNLDDAEQSFSVISPRIVLRSNFVSHEQVLLQYSHYTYGDKARTTQYPFNNQVGAARLGADADAFQIAGIIWF